jgi:hypothetical protein
MPLAAPIKKAPFRLRPYAQELRNRRNTFIGQFSDYQIGARETPPGEPLRTLIALWRRQSGKTTLLAFLLLQEMLRYPGRLTVFASASLLVGGEVVHKMAAIFREVISFFSENARPRFLQIEALAPGSDKDVLAADNDALAAALETRKLNVRLWHDNNTFSRMQIVAPNPATARGFTGSVVVDEFGWIRDLRDVWDAMEPILSSDPTFTCLLATTPPADDTHYSYEMLVPPPGTEFAVNPRGNWYTSAAGLPVHRVDAWDGAEAGARFSDIKTGLPITPEEHRARAIDRESWDRNYALRFIATGSAAVSRLVLDRAQSHALTPQCIAIDDGEEPPAGWAEKLDARADTACGLDVATTTNEKSNYSSLTIAQRIGGATVMHLVWRWKSADPAAATARIRAVLADITRRLCRAPRVLCVDGSNELYFAVSLRDALADSVHVRIVRNSESLDILGQRTDYKQYLGDAYVNALDDGAVALPASRWLFEDHRLARKEKGRFTAALGADGCHADSFDSCKLALHGFDSAAAPGQIHVFKSRAQILEEQGVDFA